MVIANDNWAFRYVAVYYTVTSTAITDGSRAGLINSPQKITNFFNDYQILFRISYLSFNFTERDVCDHWFCKIVKKPRFGNAQLKTQGYRQFQKYGNQKFLKRGYVLRTKKQTTDY